AEDEIIADDEQRHRIALCVLAGVGERRQDRLDRLHDARMARRIQRARVDGGDDGGDELLHRYSFTFSFRQTSRTYGSRDFNPRAMNGSRASGGYDASDSYAARRSDSAGHGSQVSRKRCRIRSSAFGCASSPRALMARMRSVVRRAKTSRFATI